MKLYLEVVGDYNDADYVTEFSEITENELSEFKLLIDAIKKRGHDNWQTSEYAPDNEHPDEMYEEFNGLVDKFNNYVPYGEYGIHTIKGIRLLKVESEERLL